ncbi:unnamed protein product [Peronospora belbahrii]|uniref:Ubiquinone biosynthesis protein n=1 Tax=Peronospora belbahrii TaxID=622444 RepID=A0ABN8D546_9STRA|nr:unnamed protein product [Peronospora belbahrii]
MNFIRPSARLVAAVSSSGRRSVTCTMYLSVMERQCFHWSSPAAASIRFHSTHTRASHKETAQHESSTDPEQRILIQAMNHVPKYGWTIDAVAAGAMDLGYPSVAHGMFTRGAFDLVEYFMDSCLAKLRKTLIINTDKLQAMTVAERLKFGIRTRLEMLNPVLDSWPQGMALGALPQNAPSTAKRLAQLSDEIWYFAGDKSTDMSWYTKRAILAGVYTSTELFMLNDKSTNFQDTWAFLDRRIDETLQLGDMPQNLNDMVGMAGVGLQSMFSAVTSLTVPPSIFSSIVSGLPFTAPTFVGSVEPEIDAMAFKPKDMKEINEELGKFGGVDTSEQRN